MSVPPETFEEDSSLRCWKAAISHLPPQRRDAAWEFYMKHFADNNAGELLTGLILLMEAHAVYMQNVPLAFEAELVGPMTKNAADIKRVLQQFAEEQREIRTSTQQTMEGVDRACRVILQSGSDVAIKVQMAVQQISTEKIAQTIVSSLETSTLKALRTDFQELKEVSKRLDHCQNVAKESAQLWTSIRSWGILGCSFTFAAIFGLLFSIAVYFRLKEHYEKRLGEEIAYLQNRYSRGLPTQ